MHAGTSDPAARMLTPFRRPSCSPDGPRLACKALQRVACDSVAPSSRPVSARWPRNAYSQVSTQNLDCYFTDLMWYPISSKKNIGGGTDVFALSCTDGALVWEGLL